VNLPVIGSQWVGAKNGETCTVVRISPRFGLVRVRWDAGDEHYYCPSMFADGSFIPSQEPAPSAATDLDLRKVWPGTVVGRRG
jgi:hypothetical protein